MNPLSDVTTADDTATRPARPRRRSRATSAVVATVLALGVGVGVAACSSDDAPAQDKVAAANQAASDQSDATADQYQALSTSVTTGMELLVASEGKVDAGVLAELSTALDAARAIDPTTSFRDLDTVEEAQAKEQQLATTAKKIADAKATLDAAIAAVQAATKG